MEIFELTIHELHQKLKAKELSCVEATRAMLARIESVEERVNAYITVTPEEALLEAEAADRRIAQGGMDILTGIPIGLKDIFITKGIRTTCGSKILENFVPPYDGTAVARLKERGAVILGKLNQDEFAMGSSTESSYFGATRNPWDLDCTPGGSSGGSAAAVAAGMVPVAHGADGLGSIRIPAACCGVVGMKPSRGRVSPGPFGVDGIGLATNGVITRTVRDSAAFLDVLAKSWPGDTYAAPAPSSSFLAACERHVAPLRIGVLTEPLNVAATDVHPAALAAVNRAARLLASMGHHVGAAARAVSAEEWMAFMPLWGVMAAHVPLPPEAEAVLKPLTQWLRKLGAGVSGVQYAAAHSAMQLLARQIATRWADFDLILTPTLAQPPLPPAELELADPAADFEAQKHFTPWTSVWNMTGAPAISLPLHRAVVDGVELPFGVMLGGVRVGQEGVLYALSAALEAADPWPLIREP